MDGCTSHLKKYNDLVVAHQSHLLTVLQVIREVLFWWSQFGPPKRQCVEEFQTYLKKQKNMVAVFSLKKNKKK